MERLINLTVVFLPLNTVITIIISGCNFILNYTLILQKYTINRYSENVYSAVDYDVNCGNLPQFVFALITFNNEGEYFNLLNDNSGKETVYQAIVENQSKIDFGNMLPAYNYKLGDNTLYMTERHCSSNANLFDASLICFIYKRINNNIILSAFSKVKGQGEGCSNFIK